MAKNFYFRTDREIVSGSANFSRLINANYEAYSLTLEQAEEYAQLDAALQSAYADSARPASRTTVAVAAKNVAKRNVQERAMLLGKIIAGAAETVDDAQLLQLGLLPRATYARRTMSTTTPPVVRIASVRGRVVEIRIRAAEASAGGTGGRLQSGALGAQVYTYVGEQSPADPKQYDHDGLATREAYTIVFPNDVASGATAWVSAGWVGKRGATGITCSPVRVTVQGGLVTVPAVSMGFATRTQAA